MTSILVHATSFGIDVARLGAWLIVLSIIFVPLERWFAVPTAGAAKRGALSVDLGYYFLSSLLPAIVLAVPLSLIATGFNAVLPSAYIESVTALPLWSKIVLGLLAGELGAYWGHRWTHASPLLWRFHRVHHAPKRLYFLINTHAHPVDLVFIRLCGLLPVYALGLANPGVDRTAIVPVVVTLVATVWTFFIHADVRWRLGALEWVIATPAFHHWHHTNDENRDRNFASLLPALDRMFGTHHLPRHWPPCYGIDEPPIPAEIVKKR